MKVRNPVVAGKFYPDSPNILTQQILRGKTEICFENAVGAISPHAGYIFSGTVAAKVWSALPDRDVYVIMGPNHTGLGPICSLSDADFWLTPLGEIKVDKQIRDAIAELGFVDVEPTAHLYEHSIEVQLPFLQVYHSGARIVPIVVSTSADVEFFVSFGKALVEICSNFPDKILWVVSSDMNHYENQHITVKKDSLAIEAISKIDPYELLDVVVKNNISMCGVYPTIILLSLLNQLGNIEMKLLDYKTSGEVNKDYNQVVGYLGSVFLKQGQRRGYV